MSYDALPFPAGSRFLVTGGAGFIGSNLCEALLRMGFAVRCLDNLSTGKPANIAAFKGNPLFTFVKGDIREIRTCRGVCEGIDYVLHQAAWGSVPRSLEKPLSYCVNNVLGTVNMLEAARQSGSVKKFVYASSSAVYGDEPRQPAAEGREGGLLSPYAASKRADEEWAKRYAMHYGLPTIGLRYFNVFGRRQDPEGDYAAVIPKFIRQLLHGERPVIHGDGLQTRDFTYVENVVEANLKACLAPEKADGKAFNIASGAHECLLDAYRAIRRALGVDTEPEFGPPRPGDIRDSSANIAKARRLLKYKPEYDFARGLAEAIPWYRENLRG